jgi:hypothetical protein
MRLIVEASARTDIGEAAAWYNEQQTGLGIVLLDAVNAAPHRISIKPRLFSLRRPDVRGASLKKFPYTIYFSYTAILFRLLQFSTIAAIQACSTSG